MYTPIIRNRQSEVLAFEALTPAAKTHCTPLVDLAAPTKKADQASVLAYIERNIRRTVKAVKGFEHVLIDSSELDPTPRMGNAKHPLVEAAHAVLDSECVPIPVTGLHRDSGHMKAVLRIKNSTGERLVCFRLDRTDVQTISLTHKRLLKSLSDNSIRPHDVILLLDLQSVYGQDVQDLVPQVSRFIAHTSTSTWAAIIVAGYGVPDQLKDAVAIREQGYIPRVEQEIYHRIAAEYSTLRLWFGDYTTLSPTQVELDWKMVSRVISPKAIYALDDTWFVVRGGPFSSHAAGYGQYHDLAAEIVALEEFPGPSYSFGDKYIHERVSNVTRPGSPGTWITACVNHHITLTADAHQS